MADLTKREQVDTSFDTLYHMTKKLEARHHPCCMTKGGTPTNDTHKGYKRYSIPVGCMATVEADLFTPDPDLGESTPPEPDHIE